MAYIFTGKKFLVTGAGRGFGRAIAISLANAGGKVFALSRTQSTLDSLVDEQPGIVPITQDLTDWNATRQTLEKLEVLDGLVNNAARLTWFCPAVEFPKKELEDYLNNNVLSVINCTQVVAKSMISAERPGSIVNVSSVVSSLAYPNILGYTMCKAAVDGITRQFALELGSKGIRVNSINPTLTVTDGQDKIMELKFGKHLRAFKGNTPMVKTPKTEDVVGPVMYLLSDASALVTGTHHLIDGGLSCNVATKY